jgi:hypothetical protein
MQPAHIPSLAHLAARVVVEHHGPRVRLRSYMRELNDEVHDFIMAEKLLAVADEISWGVWGYFYEEKPTHVYWQQMSDDKFEISLSKPIGALAKRTNGKKRYRYTVTETRWQGVDAHRRGVIKRSTSKILYEISYPCPVGKENRRLKCARLSGASWTHWHGDRKVSVRTCKGFLKKK